MHQNKSRAAIANRLWSLAPSHGSLTIKSQPGFADQGLPLINGVDNLLAAVKAAFTYRDYADQHRVELPPPPSELVARWRNRLDGAGALDEQDSCRLLADFHIPVVEMRVANNRYEALAAATAICYPVVLKTAMPGHTHKSDVDGVRLELEGEHDLGAAYDDIANRLGSRVTVAQMAKDGVEVAFGSVCDPQFGPVVMVGMGGRLVELLTDSVSALAPFDEVTAHRLIDRLKGRALLDGVRGAPSADIDALAWALRCFLSAGRRAWAMSTKP